MNRPSSLVIVGLAAMAALPPGCIGEYRKSSVPTRTAVRYRLVLLEGRDGYPRALRGKYVSGHQAGRPTLWDAHTGRILERPCHASGTAGDVSADGWLCGYWTDSRGDPHGWFRLEDGRCRSPQWREGWLEQPLSISDAGEIVGEVFDQGAGRLLAVRWLDGVPRVLPDLGGAASSAQEINSSGWIAGYVADPNGPWDGRARACLWSPADELVLLPALGGESVASSIADSGYAAGRSALGMGDYPEWHAVRWSPEQVPLDLGVLPGALHSVGLGVNSAGWVVGWSATLPFDARAFLWTPHGGIIDLNDLMSPTDFILRVAHDIADDGRIAGWGTQGAVDRGFVLVPKEVTDEIR